ncbi:MAG: SH3 domain-containing protein [Richelia sp. RM2_1_2]|nr:SH3 domain-containing protein [Richelia sp. RM1_1_1]NJO62341.1 SH3 domain-containing protein [Richelia sp. RM2_1_2]
MNIVGILFFAFGILFILLGISLFTPFLSWFGRRFNSSNSSSINYNQPNSTRAASLFIGICCFVFGIFIAFASAPFLNVGNTQNNQDLEPRETVSQQKPQINYSTPSITTNSISSEYRLNCPPNRDGLNMRQAANLDAQVIRLIPCNAIGIKDKKERYFQDGVEWFLVEYQQNTGWVAGKYLKIQATQPNQNTFSDKLITKKRP